MQSLGQKIKPPFAKGPLNIFSENDLSKSWIATGCEEVDPYVLISVIKIRTKKLCAIVW